jgi:hypothetical protein
LRCFVQMARLLVTVVFFIFIFAFLHPRTSAWSPCVETCFNDSIPCTCRNETGNTTINCEPESSPRGDCICGDGWDGPLCGSTIELNSSAASALPPSRHITQDAQVIHPALKEETFLATFLLAFTERGISSATSPAIQAR